MDKFRLALWVSFAALAYYVFITWQADYPPPQPLSAPQTAAPVDTLPPLPSETTPKAAQTSPANIANETPAAQPAQVLHVRTDVLDLDISTLGGELQRADLVNYPQQRDRPNEAVQLFNTHAATYFVARSGLRATQDRPAPTHQARFTSEAEHYELQPGDDSLSVKLKWSDAQGVNVVKTYTLHRGSYAIDMSYQVENHGDQTWDAASYVQLVRRQPQVETSIFRGDTYAHIGPAAYDGKAYHNLNLAKKEDQGYKVSAAGAWMSAVQHHFIAAAVPVDTALYDYQIQADGPDAFTFSYRGPLVSVPANGSGEFRETLYVGPKLQGQLEKVGSRLELSTDYGMFTIIAQPLFWLLEKVHGYIGNWGWSIILVTLLIKLAFYKLTASSGHSMAKMRELAPRLKALQERYKDDREQLGRATMEFYKREKVNPVAGCLPMLIQMPFWMAFYWVLANSVEIRQAPFMFWIHDLTARDPYFVLPAILGVANYAQFKLNPAPADPVQAKVMGFMPIMMTVMMAWFPAGLSLYWVTNTLLSILQQWHINRVVAAASKKP